MDWLENIIPYIPWIAVIIIVFLSSDKAKKITELEQRIEVLEKELKEIK